MSFWIGFAQCALAVVAVSVLVLWPDGGARAADRQSMISQFSADVQPRDSAHPQFDIFETCSNDDAMTEEQVGLLARLT